MKKIEIKNKNSFILENVKRKVGQGSCANCYLLKDGRVLKLYKNSYKTDELFRINKDMESHLEELSKINVENVTVPEELVLLNGKVAGYIYNYVDAKPFGKISKFYNIKNLIQENYEKLDKNMKILGDLKVELFDIHGENILYNGDYHIIDVDFSATDREYANKKVHDLNMQKINKAIIHSLFNVSQEKEIYFKLDYFDRLFIKALYEDYRAMYIFFKELEHVSIENKMDMLHVKRKILTTKTFYDL